MEKREIEEMAKENNYGLAVESALEDREEML